MSEWWTYRPSDFLLFSSRTYGRLFELYNAALWPVHALVIAVALGLAIALVQGRPGTARAGFALLGLAWCWIAWAFHWQRFAAINWAAAGYAIGFAAQGLLLLAFAVAGRGESAPAGPARRMGLGLLLFAVVAQPVLGVLLGRPWLQAEVAGLAPDPTALATLGWLLCAAPAAPASPAERAARWLLWPLPLLWCAITGLTLATMGSGQAPLLPLAAVLALAAAARRPQAR